MARILAILFLSLGIFTSSFAGNDGENELSKSKNGEVKDCFEKLNRGIFAFNQVIDGTIFEPLAKGYKYLPSPVRTGTSNFVGNVSTLLTIPNNVLQGDLDIAGKNTLRFIVNTTVGIVGLLCSMCGGPFWRIYGEWALQLICLWVVVFTFVFENRIACCGLIMEIAIDNENHAQSVGLGSAVRFRFN